MKKLLSLVALILAFACLFTSCIQIDQGGANGIDGKDGVDGKDGNDGITPTIEISPDGYWVINGVKTEYKAICDCSNSCNCHSNGNEGTDNNDHIHSFVDGRCECGETDPNYVAPVTNEYTLGLGIVFGDITNAQINATIATVVLNSNGVIVDCKIDAVQNRYTIGDTIIFSNLLTKKELGFDYHMAAYGFDNNGDGIVKEWFEQAAAFEAWCVGKTIAEVAAMETQTMSNGYVISADEALLAAGCTISIGDFVAAVVKAGNDDQAMTFTTEGEIVLGLGINSADNGSTGDDFEATISMNIDFAAIVTVDGVIVAALNDAAQPKIVVEDGVVISTSVGKGEGVLKTKRA